MVEDRDARVDLYQVTAKKLVTIWLCLEQHHLGANAMKRKIGQNPYCDFKSDPERRRALNTLAWSKATVAFAAAHAIAPVHWMEIIRWLMRLFH
jgi:hypothetical protein